MMTIIRLWGGGEVRLGRWGNVSPALRHEREQRRMDVCKGYYLLRIPLLRNLETEVDTPIQVAGGNWIWLVFNL